MVQTLQSFLTSGLIFLVIILLALAGRLNKLIRRRLPILLPALLIQLIQDTAAFLKLQFPEALTRALTGLLVLFLASFLIYLLKDFLEAWLTRKGFRVSKLVWDVVTVLLYSILVLVLLKELYGFSVTPLLATSAVVTVVLGLALQDTLANLIAGIVFHFENSIRLGDWVEIDGLLGEVKELSWRAIRLETNSREVVLIPNQEFTKRRFVNLSRVGAARVREIGTSYDDDPDRVMDVLRKAVLSTPGVRWSPEPHICIREFADFAVVYRIRFFITDFHEHMRVEGDMMRNIWYRFQEAGIRIPFPVRTLQIERKATAAESRPVRETGGARSGIVEAVRGVDMFHLLDATELEHIADYAGIYTYPRGTVIALEGERGDSMFVILEGTVDILKGARRVASLGAQQIVGEIALFTGQRRTASIRAASELRLLVIRKEGFDSILRGNRDFIAKIEEMITARLNASPETGDEGKKADTHRSILSQIRHYLLGD